MKAFTPAQISQYLSHIAYPSPTPPPPTLDTLRTLAAHHLVAVPFESLSLHYSPTRQLTVDPDALFDKIVRRGRGGYCMEVNTLLASVLKGLGFDVYSLGARISFATNRKEGEGFDGWSHMANIITIDGTPYLFDLAFGANTPLTPLPLPQTTTTTTIANRKLSLKPLLATSHPTSPPSLIYSHRDSPSHPWVDAYALSREEFHNPDFRVMNLSTMTSSIFTRMVFCVRAFFPDEAWFVDRRERDGCAGVVGKPGEIAGQLTLSGGTLKYRLLNTPVSTEAEAEGPEWREDVPLATFTTEDERIEALGTYFGIQFSEEEKRAIFGTPTALECPANA